MKKAGITKLLIIICFLISSFIGKSQVDSLGINFQGVARNAAGSALPLQNISLKFSIYSGAPVGIPVWEETHNVTTNIQGLYSVIIGNGITTGAGSLSSFSSISWQTANQQVIISMDLTGGTSFVVIDTFAFQAVPYAYYAGSAGSLSSTPLLNNLADVDTSSIQVMQILKWNGSSWIAANDNDSDTALFAYSATNATNSDTAQTALNLINVPDSVLFANNSDTSHYSLNALTATNANHAVNADTAQFAWNCSGSFTSWSLTGNAGTSAAVNFLGTTDNTDLVIRTNNIERMRLLNNGRIGIGTSSPLGAFHLNSNDGFVSTGVFGTGSSLTITGAGTRLMWYPKKAAFRAGSTTGGSFDEINIGNYSFACGLDNVARGNYSFAAGQSSTVYSDFSVAMGYGNTSNGLCTFTAGSLNNASAAYCIAMGRGCISSDSNAVAIGYHTTSSGKYSIGFGFQNQASGDYSMTMGYHANTNNKTGSIVFSDASTSTYTASTADNQFVVRASGGFFFYSNSALTTGVTLASGSGSWASVSDRRMKKNFRSVDHSDILSKLAAVPVYSWNYISQDDAIRHIGPMAQDFYKQFGFGESDTTISTVDIDGVNFVALQALEIQTRELKKKSIEIEQMKKELEMIRQKKEELEKRVNRLEKLINGNSGE